MTESRRPHILVIDDAQPVLELFNEILRTEGYRVSLSAAAGCDIDAIKQANVDLIILDLVFKSKNLGMPLVQAVKLDPDTEQISIIVCTGADRVVDAIRADLTRHAVAVIRKPFDIDDLLMAVGNRLGQPVPPPSVSLADGTVHLSLGGSVKSASRPR